MKNNGIQKGLSTKLKAVRRFSGLSQTEAANILDVTISHYSRMEKGERNPSFELCKKIRNRFGIDPIV